LTSLPHRLPACGCLKNYRTVYTNYRLKQLEQNAATLLTRGITLPSLLFDEAERVRLGLPPIDKSASEIATSDVYHQEYKPYQAKKTSDGLFSGLFSGFGF
jgi:hypothetical protein